MKLRAALPLVSLVLAAVTAPALETDQYWAWGRPIADSTAAVNAKLNLELARAVASLPDHRPPIECRKVAAVFRSRMRFILMHDFQVWAWNSKWVARVPDGGDEERDYRRSNLYSRHPPFDTGTWMPFTPTIEVAGVRIGTDKLAHFVSSGWTMYTEYDHNLSGLKTAEEAELVAVRRALLEESLILGGLTSGIQAVADLEAGAAGMRFYRDLCDADDPILARDGERWVVTRPVDLADYVTPRWDESFQPSVFHPGRWRKVRPVLEGYCDRLDDPQVVAMRRAYRERDHGSLVARVVAERVTEGELADPDTFGIEAVCGVTDPSRAPGPPILVEPASPSPEDGADVVRGIVEEELDRRRTALGLAGAHLTYPQVFSASLAVMVTSQPTSYDCRTPCDFRGPFAELEPGIGGGKLSLGWARVTGTTGRSGSFLSAAYFGVAYKLTILRTWGDVGWVPANRTYAGFELGVPVARANVGIGLLARVDGGDGRPWTVTGSVGWGF